MIRALTRADVGEAGRLVEEVLGNRMQARLGAVVDVLALPGVGAWDGDRLVGIATYSVSGEQAEVAALGVTESHRGRGVAGRLLDVVVAEVTTRPVRRVWVVTTNDNLTALAVYQKHGFRMVELRAGAIDQARAVKPTIPAVGRGGIPMHDEIVLERRFG